METMKTHDITLDIRCHHIFNHSTVIKPYRLLFNMYCVTVDIVVPDFFFSL